MNNNINKAIVAMDKKRYLIPVVDVVCIKNESFMKYTGPASVPDQAGAPAKPKKSEVF